jgi:hypothetical protein
VSYLIKATLVAENVYPLPLPPKTLILLGLRVEHKKLYFWNAGVTQMIQYLLWKHKALSSNSSTTKKNQRTALFCIL